MPLRNPYDEAEVPQKCWTFVMSKINHIRANIFVISLNNEDKLTWEIISNNDDGYQIICYANKNISHDFQTT